MSEETREQIRGAAEQLSKRQLLEREDDLRRQIVVLGKDIQQRDEALERDRDARYQAARTLDGVRSELHLIQEEYEYRLRRELEQE